MVDSQGQAGITTEDSIEEARRKFSQWQASQGIIAEPPKIQNFGTSDNPNWNQWNPQTGQWEQISEVQAQQVIQESAITTESYENYTWNETKLTWLANFAPTAATASAYEKQAILAFAYASSGKQMSWNEAKQLYSAYIPQITDLGKSKINKLLSLKTSIESLVNTATGNDLVQAKIAQEKMNLLFEELDIEKTGQKSGSFIPEDWEYISYTGKSPYGL
jgi:hypothetical protein